MANRKVYVVETDTRLAMFASTRRSATMAFLLGYEGLNGMPPRADLVVSVFDDKGSILRVFTSSEFVASRIEGRGHPKKVDPA
jgi:hypothetical protein